MHCLNCFIDCGRAEAKTTNFRFTNSENASDDLTPKSLMLSRVFYASVREFTTHHMQCKLRRSSVLLIKHEVSLAEIQRIILQQQLPSALDISFRKQK